MMSFATWVLPEIGTDWLDGLQNCYILLAPHLSQKGKPVFHRRGMEGFCNNVVEAGVTTGVEMAGQIWKYNDGTNVVAIPLTVTALSILGLMPNNFDPANLGRFANHEIST